MKKGRLFNLLALAFLFALVGLAGSFAVRAATTDLDVTMSAGSLTLASSASATLSGLTVSTTSQNPTGSIANVSVTDERGSGEGWSVTMTSTHFTTRATHKTLVDIDADGITGFTGTYDGLDGILDPNGTFIVEVTTGGAVGTAVFEWTDPAGNVTSTVGMTATNLLSNGITVDWDDVATYDVGDKFSAGVDVFPYTGLTVTPGATTAASGSLTGITDGTSGALTGSAATSDAKTVVTADVNTGFGDYDQAEALSLAAHANSLAGSFGESLFEGLLERKSMTAKSPYDARWQRFRKGKLSREPLCAYCLELGHTTAATEVHHVVPIRERPDLRLSDANTIGLCKACHDGPAQAEEKTGIKRGCLNNGMPRDSNHKWSEEQ